jgi:hypothetical protein
VLSCGHSAVGSYRQTGQSIRQLCTTQGVFTRIQKLLKDANIKLASVASDVPGLSGSAMLHAIVGGQDDPEKLAEIARGKLRRNCQRCVWP